MTSSSENQSVLISIVTPMYNEETACPAFFAALLPVLQSVTDDFEVVCVDDGSTDSTLAHLLHRREADPRIKVVALQRNFGKDMALMAGINYSSGQAVIPIDADLQDPPELIPEMVQKWREGFDTVICVRSERSGDTRVKRWLAAGFYRVMGRVSSVDLPPNAGDFRLLDRKLVHALRLLPERSRFMKGLYALVGSNPTYIHFSRPARIAGDTKWAYWRLWNFALDGIFSFTTLPLRVWTYFGGLVAATGLGYALLLITGLLSGLVTSNDWLMVAVLFIGGCNMIGIGVLGEYIGRIFDEVKNRPMYLVDREYGFDDSVIALGRNARAVSEPTTEPTTEPTGESIRVPEIGAAPSAVNTESADSNRLGSA